MLCLFAVIRGWNVTRFAAASVRLAPHEDRPDAFLAWTKVAGVGDLALEAWLTRMVPATGIDAARRRADILAELLAVRPMSSVDWLSLAGMAFATAQPRDKILAALTMSWVTGPNEGSIMVSRAIFGLLRWEALPDDARRRAAGDLAEAVREDVAPDASLNLVKTVVNAKSGETRAQIMELLKAEQIPPAGLARLGL